MKRGAGAPSAAEDSTSKKVPGAAACPVRVEAFLNSFPRWLLKMAAFGIFSGPS